MDKYFAGFPGFRELLFPPDTPESLFSRLPALDTPRLSLRKMQMRDAADIYAWASDPLVSRYVLWDSHKSIADIELEMHRCGKRHCRQHTYHECQHRKERHNDIFLDSDEFAVTFLMRFSSINLIF